MATPNPLPGPAGTNLVAKILAVIGSIAVLAVGFVFSVVLFVVAVIAGSALLGYFWWKTRALRKAMREQAAQAPFERQPGGPFAHPAGGRVIEGEVIRENDESTADGRDRLPGGAAERERP